MIQDLVYQQIQLSQLLISSIHGAVSSLIVPTDLRFYTLWTLRRLFFNKPSLGFITQK